MQRHSLSLLVLITLLLAALSTSAQQPLGVNLLVNGDFETGTISGWTAVTGSTFVHGWNGSTNHPPFGVSLAIGGGSFLVSDNSGNAVLRQTFDVTGNAINGPGFEFVLDACLGGIGSETNGADLFADFRDTNGLPLGTGSLGLVTASMRNSESLLLRRVQAYPVPTGTTSIRVEIRFSYFGGPATGFLDNAQAMLRSTTFPPAKSLGVNLMVNGDFEGGWSATSAIVPNDPQSWFGATSSQSIVHSYAFGTSIPATDVAAIIGGGANLVRDWNGGNSSLAQIIDVRGNVNDIDANLLAIDVGAMLGGFGSISDSARVDVTFLDRVGSGALPIGTVQSLGSVTVVDRQQQSILMSRRRTIDVPQGTRAIRVALVFTWVGGAVAGCADNISASLVLRAPTPPAPLGVQLLVNGDFETGNVIGGMPSPFTLTNPQGWTGLTSASVSRVQPYALGGNVPSIDASAAVAGGTNLVRDWNGGSSSLAQVIDVRGNAVDIDANLLAIDVGAMLGGFGSISDNARVDVTFLDRVGAGALPIGAVQSVGPVTVVDRQARSVLMSRQRTIDVPQGTRAIRVALVFTWVGGAVAGCADNVSATLVLRAPVSAPLGVQLIVNGDFESGDMIDGSLTPFTLADPQGWTGVTTASSTGVEGYGTNGTVPPFALAGVISGGNYLAADFSGGSARLRQTIDVSNNPQVSAGTLRLFASGYFGGFSSDSDTARLDIVALNPIGAQLASFSIGSVTPAERANITTVLLRQGDFGIPQGTSMLRIELVMTYFGAGSADGLADNLVVTLYDSTMGGPDNYPGTGGNTDLHLFTGLNAQPTTGPGFDIKNAQGGDILYLKLASFSGNADFSPILMAYQIFTTGVPPTPVFPGVALDPLQTVIFVDGVTFAGFFGQPILIPGGTTFVSVIPPGFAGFSVLIQGFAFPGLAGLPAVPPNGVFFGAAAHELRL